MAQGSMDYGWVGSMMRGASSSFRVLDISLQDSRNNFSDDKMKGYQIPQLLQLPKNDNLQSFQDNFRKADSYSKVLNDVIQSNKALGIYTPYGKDDEQVGAYYG